jgi:hypothetical protein
LLLFERREGDGDMSVEVCPRSFVGVLFVEVKVLSVPMRCCSGLGLIEGRPTGGLREEKGLVKVVKAGESGDRGASKKFCLGLIWD